MSIWLSGLLHCAPPSRQCLYLDCTRHCTAHWFLLKTAPCRKSTLCWGRLAAQTSCSIRGVVQCAVCSMQFAMLCNVQLCWVCNVQFAMLCSVMQCVVWWCSGGCWVCCDMEQVPGGPGWSPCQCGQSVLQVLDWIVLYSTLSNF